MRHQQETQRHLCTCQTCSGCRSSLQAGRVREQAGRNQGVSLRTSSSHPRSELPGRGGSSRRRSGSCSSATLAKSSTNADSHLQISLDERDEGACARADEPVHTQGEPRRPARCRDVRFRAHGEASPQPDVRPSAVPTARAGRTHSQCEPPPRCSSATRLPLTSSSTASRSRMHLTRSTSWSPGCERHTSPATPQRRARPLRCAYPPFAPPTPSPLPFSSLAEASAGRALRG